MLLEADEKTSSTKHPNLILFIPLILELSEYGSVLAAETTGIYGPRSRPARRRQREGQLWNASVIVLDLAASDGFGQEGGEGCAVAEHKSGTRHIHYAEKGGVGSRGMSKVCETAKPEEQMTNS